jgi:hypothetical protein
VTRYLLAAEADKIQDLIFRSARLREVAGGSQLLTRFCEEVPPLLLPPDAEIIISDGGSFRVLFHSEAEARTFGERLAEVYRRATGGSLTVAEPVPYDGAFQVASQQAEETLRRAKRWREGEQAQEHLPYIALCASCGVGLAVAHQAYHEGEEKGYLCASCLNKSAERAEQRAQDETSFLGQFYRTVVPSGKYDWPGKEKRRGRQEKDPLEDVADYDPRRYVAYLLADGNEMGKVFGACQTPDQMCTLSKELPQVMRKALAEPTMAIMQNNPMKDRPDFIPVWPLILGGDDLFALIPAPWALDFAHRFCLEYERKMTALFENIGLTGVPCPTVSVAVVICKSKHPYALAHAAGEVSLKQAKRMEKQRMLGGQQPMSVINFEVVLGGRLVAPPDTREVRPTLRPYWVGDPGDGWGLSLQKLIEQREALRRVPRKRLAELRDLYDDLPTSTRTDDLQPWQDRLERLLARIGRDEAHHKAVTDVLSTLGGDKGSAYWRKVDRPPQDGWHGHGLPDLLEAWDFAFALDKPLSAYEEER